MSIQTSTFLDETRHAMQQHAPYEARLAEQSLLTGRRWPAAAALLSTPPRGGLAPWQTRKLNQYISACLGGRVRVDDLAKQVRLSASHFCRAFKQTFGQAPHAHVMQLRLEQARARMLASDEPMCQIAAACGFADQAHFTRRFRRQFNETPAAWRRRQA